MGVVAAYFSNRLIAWKSGAYLHDAAGFANSSKLSAASIGNGNFGKRQSWRLDGAVYAQPLYAPGRMHAQRAIFTERFSGCLLLPRSLMACMLCCYSHPFIHCVC